MCRPGSAVVLARCAAVSVALALLAETGAAQASLPEQVNVAIDHGVAYLKAQQNKDGTFPCSHWCPVGSTALSTYALLKSGVLPSDPAVQKAMAYLAYQPFEKTYAVSVEIAALDAFITAGDRESEKRLLTAASWIEEHQREGKDAVDAGQAGMWGYPDKRVDLSNTQYAALGLWVAERHGFKAKKETWASLLKAVTKLQNKDGGFGYLERDDSTGSMTTAGIAVILITLQKLENDPRYGTTREKGKAVLTRAWKWLDDFYTVEGNPNADRTVVVAHNLYYLFGLERVCAIGDKKRLADHDWYADGARRLVREQRDDGSWHDPDGTSFALLFLRRATLTGMHKDGDDGFAERRHVSSGGPERPGPLVPFFRRWLVCGPIPDPKDSLLEASYDADTRVEPAAGASYRGQRWTELRARGDRIDLGPDGHPGDGTLTLAATWLHVAQETDVVIWLSTDDGGQLLLDGKAVFTRHVHERASRDAFSVPVKLAAGVHRLLLKVESWKGESGFFLRAANPDGSLAPEIRPSLSRSDPELAATALAMPGLFTPQELRANLPPVPSSPSLDLGFDSAKELDLVAIDRNSGAKDEVARFLDEPAPRPGNPMPGARGIVALHPKTKEIGARLYFRATVPSSAEPKLVVRLSEDVYVSAGQADFLFRAGVLPAEIDEIEWFPDQPIGPHTTIAAESWTTVELPLAKWAGQDALFVLEFVAGGSEEWKDENAYVDEIAIR